MNKTVINNIDGNKLYKVISKDCLAQNGGSFNYSDYLPKGNKKGKWTPKEKVIKCESGYHITKYWNMWLKNDDDLIFLVECKDLMEDDSIGVINKYVCSQIRLVKQVKFIFNNNYNTGDYNIGDYNIGDFNTGDYNTRDYNTGNYNTGYNNTGYNNTGDYNTGYNNTGDYNTGDYNTGYNNTGDCNTGNYNTGYNNTGYFNTGNRNTGNRNTGDWNISDNNTGFFNTKAVTKIIVFDKEVDKEVWDKAYKPCFLYFNLLKGKTYKESFIYSFNNDNNNDIKTLLDLPNFDYKIFEKISGITKKMIEDKIK